jgi:pyruvate/2-oxoglutarate dehydrogenase complex dihydrolipoamide acyltransferase (E2) component
MDTLAKEPEAKELEVTAGISFEEEEEETEGVRLSFEEEEDETEGVRISFEKEKEEEATPAAPPVDVGGRVVLNRIPFMGMRRTIANNLMASLRTGAQLTVVNEVDMTELAHFRKELMLDDLGEKVTFVDMLVKLLASVLKEFPIINSSMEGDEIICWGEYHIGVAVALENGLVVPVVRNADQKSLLAVSREIKKLARKAQKSELNPEHYTGGTFTLSSGGKIDVDFMTPIINPPQNAILGIGKIGPRPAVHQGQLTIRTTTYLCLTHDHRIIDGAPAGMFLGRLKEVIERPEQFQKILK